MMGNADQMPDDSASECTTSVPTLAIWMISSASTHSEQMTPNNDANRRLFRSGSGTNRRAQQRGQTTDTKRHCNLPQLSTASTTAHGGARQTAPEKS